MTAAPGLTVVVPAFNEADILVASVDEIVGGLRARRGDFEVVVVENGSTDGTAAIADGLAARNPEVRARSLPRADYGHALREGFLAAEGDVVVNFDADYYDLGFLDLALERLRAPEGPVVVVGSKRAPGADDGRPLLRRLVTGVFSLLLRVGFGLRVSDTHGMKAIAREPAAPVVRRCRFGRDLFDTELILRLERAGMSVEEVPVAVRERRPARTSVLRRAPRALWGLVTLRVALWREARGSHE